MYYINKSPLRINFVFTMSSNKHCKSCKVDVPIAEWDKHVVGRKHKNAVSGKGKRFVLDLEADVPLLGKGKMRLDTNKKSPKEQSAPFKGKMPKAARNAINQASGVSGTGRRTLLSEPMRTVLGPIELSGASAATGDVLLNGLFTPNIQDTRLVNISKTWQQYRFINAKLVYDPVVSQLTPGQIGIFVTSDPMDILTAQDIDVLNVVTEHGGALIPVGKPRTVALPRPNSLYYYVDEAGPDPRLIYQGQYFVVACSALSTEGGLPLGTLYMEYQVEWSSQQIEGIVDEEPGAEYLSIGLAAVTPLSLTLETITEFPGIWSTWQHNDHPGWLIAQEGASLHLLPGVYEINAQTTFDIEWSSASGDACIVDLLLYKGATAGALTTRIGMHRVMCTNLFPSFMDDTQSIYLLFSVDEAGGEWITLAHRLAVQFTNDPSVHTVGGGGSAESQALNNIIIQRLAPNPHPSQLQAALSRRRYEVQYRRTGLNHMSHNRIEDKRKFIEQSDRVKAEPFVRQPSVRNVSPTRVR